MAARAVIGGATIGDIVRNEGGGGKREVQVRGWLLRRALSVGAVRLGYQRRE